MTVWRLSSDWGYPRGPHGKTRLESKASLNAAKNRWALTEQDALDMNLHLCSWAPAEAVEVNKCAFMEIWDHNGAGSYVWRNKWKDVDVRIFDERCLPHIDDSGELWDMALNHQCATTDTTITSTGSSATTARTTTTGTTRTTTTSRGGSGGATGSISFGSRDYGTTATGGSTSRSGATSSAASSSRAGASSARDGIPSALAYTGAASRTLVGTGAGLVLGGAALSAFAARTRRVAEAAAAVDGSST